MRRNAAGAWLALISEVEDELRRRRSFRQATFPDQFLVAHL